MHSDILKYGPKFLAILVVMCEAKQAVYSNVPFSSTAK